MLLFETHYLARVLDDLFFLLRSVNGENYLKMLREVVMPQLYTKPNFYRLFFQQDKAPPQYVLRERNYLNEVFPQRWFERNGNINWLPRSPDLTIVDFCLGGVV